MKLVKYVDAHGWKRQSYIKDDMPDEQAQMGIPLDVPDLRQINMDQALAELNNLLFEREIFTIDDVKQKQNQLRQAVETIFFPKVLQLYKEQLNQEVYNG